MLELKKQLREEMKTNQEVVNKIMAQLLEKINTNQEVSLATNTELRSLVEELTVSTPAAEDALDLV